MPTNVRCMGGCLAALVLLAGPGCGSRTTFTYALVSGKVTLGGYPLPGVKVVFHPDSENPTELPFATAVTDASGNYTLTLRNGKPGALVGRNRVVLGWPSRPRPAEGAPPPPPNPVIPGQYMTYDLTPLIVDVLPGGPQTIDLPIQ